MSNPWDDEPDTSEDAPQKSTNAPRSTKTTAPRVTPTPTAKVPSKPISGPKKPEFNAPPRGKPAAKPKDLYVRMRESSFKPGEFYYTISLTDQGLEKWGLDTDYWYNLNFTINAESRERAMNGEDIAIGCGMVGDPKPKTQKG